MNNETKARLNSALDEAIAKLQAESKRLNAVTELKIAVLKFGQE